MEKVKHSEWLVSLGWRPSPTTHDPGDAWEHVAWSKVPECCVFAVALLGVYCPEYIRHPVEQASAISMAMLALSEECVVIPRDLIEGQT